jgi:hypothetical protein
MRIFSLLILFSLSTGAFAQSNFLKGEVLNDVGAPLTSSTVVLLNPADSTMQYFGISGTSGQFEIKNIKSGKYLMQIAFIGYETIYIIIDVPFKNNGDVGPIPMMQKTVSLDEVTVTGERVPLRIKQDTLEYDARAFKVKPDAVVEDLLKKLPGIEVDRAGNIKALGEDVTTILVDGKEFFSGDAKIATKNIPADALDKVQVYNKKSEEAEFTGIEDGTRNQTINLQLDEDKKDGVFGELMAGGGTGEHYQANGKVYRFSDKSQIAALGMINNVNKYGFDFGDYLSFTGGIANISHGEGMSIGGGGFPINFGETVPGFATSGAVGFNYSYSTSSKNRYYISYLGSGSRRKLNEEIKTTSYRELDSYYTEENTRQEQRDTSHNINFGIRHLFKETNNIIIDGGFSFNTGFVPLNSISENYLNDNLVSVLDRKSSDISDRISGNIRGTYMKKINEGRTVLKLSGNGSISNSNSETEFSNLLEDYVLMDTVYSKQFQKNDIKNISYGGSASFTQKISGPYFFDLTLSARRSDQTLSRIQQDRTSGTSIIIDTLSPDFDKRERSVQPGLALRRSSKKSTIYIGLDYNIGIYTTSLWDDGPIEESYRFLQAMFGVEHEYKTGRRISFKYSSRTNTPTANQLLPVVNNFNSLSLFYGNRDLEPEFIHSLSANWWIFDQFSFTSFMLGARASKTNNKINYSRTITDQLGQEIHLVNVDRDFNASANIDFSTPIRPLGIKTNLSIEESVNLGLNIVDDIENEVTNYTHRLSLTFDNRKKDKWDINTGAGVTITNATYSIQESLNNVYYDVSWFGEIRFTPNEKLDMDVSADITNYTAKSFDEAQLVPLIGAQISYFFMKGNRAAITLSGFDLLNRNTGITRVAEMNYLRESQSNIIGRYIMLSFKYRLNKFGGDTGMKIDVKKR